MAAYYYPLYQEALNKGLITGGTNGVNMKFVFVTSGYAYSAADEFLAAIDESYRLQATGNLTDKAFDGLAFDAADPIASAVTGAAVAAVCYYDTGNAETSRLHSYHAITPVTYAGQDVVIGIDAAGILKAPAA